MMKTLMCAMAGIVGLVTPAYADDDQMYCLQQNVYFEARNQPLAGKIAVAWVTLNRVASPRYPDTICEVVWQSKQFSWTHDGKSDTPSNNILEQKAWELSGMVANISYDYWSNDFEGPIGSSTMFHADYVDPYWKPHFVRVAQVGDHIFYKEK